MARTAALLWFVLAVCCVGPATSASAQTAPHEPQPVEARVRALLSGIEDAPTREEVLALGEPGLDALLRIHGDARERGVIRLRAIACAGWFSGPRSRALLLRLLRQGTREVLELRAAIRAYVGQLLREGPREAQAIEPLLRHAQHADPAVREAVLIGLVELHAQASPRERAVLSPTLERLLATEPDAGLARAIRARLAR
jgi:uncharacterized membrane protein